MTDRKPGEAITVGGAELFTCEPLGDVMHLIVRTIDGDNMIPITEAHALAAAITTLAAEAGHPASVAGVAVKPLEWGQSAYFPAVSLAWDPLFERNLYAENPGDKERIEAKRAARIRSALAPAQQDTVALVAQLVTALTDAQGGLDYIRFAYGSLSGVGFGRCQKKTAAALAAARAWKEGK